MYFEVNDANEYYEVALKVLKEKGKTTTVRGNKTVEIINPTFVVNNPTHRVNTERNRKWPRKGFTAEYLWYHSGNNNVQTIEKYLPVWRKFADNEGRVNSNYGNHWHPYIYNIIEILKNDSSARHACFSIYDSKYSTYSTKDIPCTFSGQFLIREEKGIPKLNLIIFNRSRDLIKGELGGDFYCFSILQELVANELNIPVGKYISMIGSLHIYEPDFDKMFTECSFADSYYAKKTKLKYFDFFEKLDHLTDSKRLKDWQEDYKDGVSEDYKEFILNDYVVSTVVEKNIDVSEFYKDYIMNNHLRLSLSIVEPKYF